MSCPMKIDPGFGFIVKYKCHGLYSYREKFFKFPMGDCFLTPFNFWSYTYMKNVR